MKEILLTVDEIGEMLSKSLAAHADDFALIAYTSHSRAEFEERSQVVRNQVVREICKPLAENYVRVAIQEALGRTVTQLQTKLNDAVTESGL